MEEEVAESGRERERGDRGGDRERQGIEERAPDQRLDDRRLRSSEVIGEEVLEARADPYLTSPLEGDFSARTV
jgi:hypothetical protein